MPMHIVLGHGASGTAASMKPYVDGFKRRHLDATAVDLPKNNADRAVEVFVARAGRDVVAGGQAYRGSMGRKAAGDAEVAGLLLLSHSLLPPGLPAQVPTQHLLQLRLP